MPSNYLIKDQTPQVIASAVTAAPFPPVKVLDVQSWNDGPGGVLPSFDLEIWAAAAAIELTAEKGYAERVDHRPRTVAYGVSATLSAAVATTATATPVREK